MVEKMYRMNLVAPVEDLEALFKEFLLTGKVSLVDTAERIQANLFTVPLEEAQMEERHQLCQIDLLPDPSEVEAVADQLEELKTLLAFTETVPLEAARDKSFASVKTDVEELYRSLTDTAERVRLLEETAAKLSRLEALEALESLDIDFSTVQDMTYFTYRLGTLSRENRVKLDRNDENIAALFFPIETHQDEEMLLVLFPKSLEEETDRILRSVYFEEIKIPPYLADKPPEMVKKITAMAYDVHFELLTLQDLAKEQARRHGETLALCEARLELERRMIETQRLTVCSEHFIYLSGWVPESAVASLKESVAALSPKTTMHFEAVVRDGDGGEHPPTQLKNPSFFRPFEEIVELYGVPAYDEVDPTIFVGLTYMLLFGAMFGDLGQGLLLVLGGFYLSRRTLYGDILLRLGVVSALFGVLYDSVFGYEHVISKLLPWLPYFRPIENTDSLLIASIVLGGGLLLLSYGYSLMNKWRTEAWGEALFGRNGLAGLVLYLSLVFLAIDRFLDVGWIPDALPGYGIVTALGIMLFSGPLGKLITGERPYYEEGAGGYFVESGFDLFETLLSLLSNSLSFVRVGAFALNHVGLFIAFHTMATLIGGLGGEVAMMILGNLIVIFLEGLIVLIQSLRLIYYELFSKYYRGEGVAFVPGVPSRTIRGG